MAEQAATRYGLLPVEQTLDPSAPIRRPGVWPGLVALWQQGDTPTNIRGFNARLEEPEPGFDEWAGLDGYEGYEADLITARSKAEQDAMKAMLDRRRADEDIMARNEWGMMQELAAGLLVGIFDPLNLIPIPAVKGLGIVRGALTAGAANTAISAVSGTARLGLDPGATAGELVGSVGLSGLLGALLGAPAGAWGARARRASRDFERQLSEVDWDNVSLEVRGRDEGLEILLGDKPLRQVDGTTGRFSLSDEPGRYVMKEINGENYTYQDGAGIIRAADRELDSPQAVGQDIADQFGVPERTIERRLRVDQAGLKADFAKDGWKDDVRPMLGPGDALEGVIRNADDYVNFATRHELWKQKLPREAGESMEAWNLRTGKPAIKELKASRVGGSLARAKGMEWVLEKMQLSPVARGARIFKGDNVVLDTLTRLGGDYGWAIRAAEFGFRAPPPLTLQALKYHARWHEWQQEFDQHWLRYASGEKQAVGKSVLSYNLSAAFEAGAATINRLRGRDVLTYDDFAQMVGQAVYSKGSFEIRGHKVNEHARAAAKSLTRMMQEMDDAMSGAGLFADQQALKRSIGYTEREIVRLRERLERWRWGEGGAPSSLEPAIRVGTRVWRGATHADAERAMIDELGEAGLTASEALTPDSYGYVPRIVEPEVHAMEGPPTYAEADYLRWREEAYGDVGDLADDPEFLADTREEFEAELKLEREIEQDRVRAEIENRAEDEYFTEQLEEEDTRAKFNVYSHDTGYDTFTTVGQALDHLIARNEDPQLTALARSIRKEVADTAFRVVERDDPVTRPFIYNRLLGGALGVYEQTGHDVHVRGSSWQYGGQGGNTEVVLHEAVHAAVARRIQLGLEDLRMSDGVKDAKLSPHAKATSALIDFQNDLLALPRRAVENMVELDSGVDVEQFMAANPEIDEPAIRTLLWQFEAATSDPHEILTYGLTSPVFRQFLATIPWEKDRSWLDRFWEIVGRILGRQPEEMTQLRRLNELLVQTTRTAAPGYGPTGNLAVQEMNAPPGSLDEAFVTQEQLAEQRRAGMSEKQLAIDSERASALMDAETQLADMKAQLLEIEARPHRFLDANGQPEPYLPRFWLTDKMAGEREQIIALVEAWFARDNPHGAFARAEKTVDQMITGDEGSAYARMGAFRQANRRALDIPNSWEIEHPAYGKLRIADYIENNALTVTETYMRKGGARIVATEMFGDADLKTEKRRVREHLLNQYWEKQTTDEGRAAVMADIQTVENHIDTIGRWALGNLRTDDPSKLTNRLARGAMDVTSLAVMGRVLLTAIPEMARPGMVAGLGTAFRTIYARALSDMPQLNHNARFNKLSNDLFDMNARRSNQRFQEMQQGDVVQRTSWIDRLISDRIPGFFRINGLMPWTVYWKDMAMSAAQHSIMEEAQRVAAAIRAGAEPRKSDELRLAALGINARDALLLADMPIEHWNGSTGSPGSLILPAVQNWTGVDGARARQLLLTASTAEMRRAIVTPSISDKSTVFAGVLTRDGKPVLQNDLMKIPMQFLSYGVAAHNKILISTLQGRDRSQVGGLFWMMLLGIAVGYLKTPSWAWEKKGYDEMMLEAWENAGIGGFWFNDLNTQIEKMSGSQLGVRPLLGMPPKYGKASQGDGPIDLAGPPVSHFADISRAFWDSELKASQRAQLLRRAVPYNNLIWQGSLARDLAGGIGRAFDPSTSSGERQ